MIGFIIVVCITIVAMCIEVKSLLDLNKAIREKYETEMALIKSIKECKTELEEKTLKLNIDNDDISDIIEFELYRHDRI